MNLDYSKRGWPRIPKPADELLRDALSEHKAAAWTAGQLDRAGASAAERDAAHDASDAAQDRWLSLLSVTP